MNYTEMESKVREATNDDAWGPTGQLMQELAQATFSYEYFPEVMSMLWRRMLIDNQSNWRRTYKSLMVLNYLVRNGAERAVTSAREHIYDLKGLENYTYIDENGKDCGINIRVRVKQLIEFIQNDEALREERKKAKKTRDKYVGVSSHGNTSMGFSKSFSDFNRYDDEFTPKNTFQDNNSNSELESSIKEEAPENTAIVKDKKVSVDVKSNTVKQKMTTLTPRIETKKSVPSTQIVSQPVIDLLCDLDLDDSITDQHSKSPMSNNATAANNADADLKEIVKNMDIFSNKRPRPIKSNKSKIPDLTAKNPSFNPSGKTSAQAMKTPVIESLKGETSSCAIKPSNHIDGSIFETNNHPNVKPSNTVESVDELDLLSINTVPFNSIQHNQVMMDGSQQSNPKVVSPEISNLNLFANDDPFGINEMASSNITPNVNNISSATLPLAPASAGLVPNGSQIHLLGEKQSTKLPETWNSLVAGTRFNLDLDNLMKSDNKKGAAPSLNQLAKVKPNNDDLFG